MLKRIFAVFLCAMLIPSAFSEEYLPKRYPVNDKGEAVIDDITFYGTEEYDDGNRVFYEIFVGSFSDSDGDGTGDLRGIINRMDYLNDGNPSSGVSLGVEGIWLTPIFSSPSYHKYDVSDFYAIDPAFGTMDDLTELIELCHQRDVKLILDLPINHTSTENKWFVNFINSHILNNSGNAYYDFYSWRNEGEDTPAGTHFAKWPGTRVLYEANFSDSMPEPDFDNEKVRKAMLDVALYYLEMGVDGFRFDAAKYIYYGDNEKSVDFWKWYIGEIRKAKPDVYTVAEVWDGEGVVDKYLTETNCFNFSASQVSGLIAETAKAGNVNRFTSYMEAYEKKVKALSENGMNILFIANHDMDRAAGFLTVASGQMKTAANLYILSPGSPFIYYGEEIGLRGSRGGANTDANRRLAMLWGDGDTVTDPEGATYPANKQTQYTVSDLIGTSGSIYNHYKMLIMIRKANPEIARGEYKALEFKNTKLGGFTSTLNGKTVCVLHNTTGSDITVDLYENTGICFNVIAAAIGSVEMQDDKVTVGAQSTAVLRMEE